MSFLIYGQNGMLHRHVTSILLIPLNSGGTALLAGNLGPGSLRDQTLQRAFTVLRLGEVRSYILTY